MRSASNFKDLTGQSFGRWTAIERTTNNSQGRAMWLCQCECGNYSIITSSDLTSGHSKSCGCLNKDVLIQRSIKHGKRNTRLYKTWCNIRRRCNDTKYISYKNYGARGITVCDEWKNDFQAFYDWAMANGYDGNAKRGECTIDRIDNDGNYEPSNCRWVSMKEQANNRRSNELIEYAGMKKNIKQWSEFCGISYATLYARLFVYGWSIDRALNKI